MAYSHARLRNTLALVRILTGATFVVFGSYKISSMQFARVGFPQFLWDATRSGAFRFYAGFLESVVWQNPGKYAVLVGFVELFIGIGLLLGLVVRPISILGMVYMVNLMLATWMAPGPDEPLWRYLDGQMQHIALFCLFLLFFMGRAGENWGLGALYHHRRHLGWERGHSAPADEVVDEGFEPAPLRDEEEELPPLPSDAFPHRSY